VVIGRAILKTDEKTKARYWLTSNEDWRDRFPLLPNENLGLPVRAFEVGTTVEIRGKLSQEAKDEERKRTTEEA
jgi:hypothetical protein